VQTTETISPGCGGATTDLMSGPRRPTEPPAADHGTVDAVDRTLVQLLVHNPRLSDRSLARAVNLPAGQVLARLTWLRHIGALRGCFAVVHPAVRTAFNGATDGALVVVSAPDDASIRELLEVPAPSEVDRIYFVAGRWNAVLRVAGGDLVDVQSAPVSRPEENPSAVHCEVSVVHRVYFKVHGQRSAASKPPCDDVSA
jgi:DNA-binding Lrp family transcriptional regulator